MTAIQPYAVIFKAFTMDRFVGRQLARVSSAASSGDVYLMMDETAGSVGPIAFDRVIRYKNADLIDLGFAPHAQGSLFWYNADYPLYYFQHLHPEYDVIVMIEYDAVLQISIDWLAQECRNSRLDFIAKPIQKALDSYWWTNSMLHFYQYDQIHPFLICVAVFSGEAVRHLAACRLRHGHHDDGFDTTQWPVGEAFVGTELILNGFRTRELSKFGQLSRYDWWPPTHESELPDLSGEAFIHPVLVGRRYVTSLFKNGYVTGLVAMMRLNLARVIFVMFVRSIWRGGRSLVLASKDILIQR
jgi:hypothetical protein